MERKEYRQHRFAPPPGACDMILVRHGESQSVVEGQPIPMTEGHADPPLHDHGRDEARLVADRLLEEEISAIYVSTLRRTHETAAPLAARLGLTPIVEPDLREVHLGEWEGVYRIRMAEGDPIARQVLEQQRWDVIPGAEPSDAFQTRVRDAVQRIAAAHADQRVVVFAHGGVIATILHHATGSRPLAFLGVDNASISHLVVLPQRWILRRFNDTGHLGTDLDKPVQPLT